LLVCEVGLGGRLDATNALDLGIAVITNVDLDHQKYLGNTIGEIAREKAAIIKHGNRVVTGCEGEALAIVEAQADAMAAQVWRLGRDVIVDAISLGWGGHELSVRGPDFAHRDLRLPLVGDYQPANAALAVAAARLLGVVGDDAIREGLASTNWPGRLQVIGQHPRVIVDGGHNPAAMVKAGTALRRLIGSEKLVAVFGMLSERDPVKLLGALRTMRPDAVVFTEATSAQGHASAPENLATLHGPDAQLQISRRSSTGLGFDQDCGSGRCQSWPVPRRESIDHKADPGEGAEERDDFGDQALSRVRYASDRGDRDRNQRHAGDDGKPAHSAGSHNQALVKPAHAAQPP